MKAHLGKYTKNGERKIEIKIDKWDSWNADATIAMLAVPILKQLKETKIGYAIVNWEDTPYSKEEWEILSNADLSNCSEEKEIQQSGIVQAVWDHILDMMIYALECCVDDWEAKYFDFTKTESMPDDLITDTAAFLPNVKYDREGHMAEEARIQQGLLWFGKYFRALWD